MSETTSTTCSRSKKRRLRRQLAVQRLQAEIACIGALQVGSACIGNLQALFINGQQAPSGGNVTANNVTANTVTANQTTITDARINIVRALDASPDAAFQVGSRILFTRRPTVQPPGANVTPLVVDNLTGELYLSSPD